LSASPITRAFALGILPAASVTDLQQMCKRQQDIRQRDDQRRDNNRIFDEDFRLYPCQDCAHLSDHLLKLAPMI
jgi:hypothetical protein